MSANILSIQSWVSFGHVGNAAAIFPLQCLGFEVWGVHTVQFSNHAGYSQWQGEVYPAESITKLVDGIQQLNQLGQCQAILSGYLGSSDTIFAVLDAVDRVRQANPTALYCCDPVMGDVGGLYVQPELPPLIAEKAIATADILTPNQFELEYLTGQKIETLEQALAAAQQVRQKMRAAGPRLLLVTSLFHNNAPLDSIENLLLTDEDIWLCRTPKLELNPPPNGTGDVLAALFLGQYLKTNHAKNALGLAVSALFALLECTQKAESREIQLVAARAEYEQPKRVFGVQSVPQKFRKGVEL